VAASADLLNETRAAAAENDARWRARCAGAEQASEAAEARAQVAEQRLAEYERAAGQLRQSSADAQNEAIQARAALQRGILLMTKSAMFHIIFDSFFFFLFFQRELRINQRRKSLLPAFVVWSLNVRRRKSSWSGLSELWRKPNFTKQHLSPSSSRRGLTNTTWRNRLLSLSARLRL
jgi:hypothetical protein